LRGREEERKNDLGKGRGRTRFREELAVQKEGGRAGRGKPAIKGGGDHFIPV